MSLDSIIKRIIQDAEKEAEQIIQDATHRAEEIKAEAQREARVQAETLIKEQERAGRLEAHRLVTQARLEKKLHLLSLKKQLVEEVLEQAFEMAGIESQALTKTVILKDREIKESYDKEILKAELRPLLENDIAEALKI